jgi:hypothetical protein
VALARRRRLTRGLKPLAFSHIIFQSAVQSADFQPTSFQLVVVELKKSGLSLMVSPGSLA